MHSFSETGANSVPAFLTKIWTLVEDPETDELISWDPSGMSFHVHDQARFAKEILPHYFKHSNIASFVRQLNMYGFRKVVHVDSGSIKRETDAVEFHHPYFIRGQENLLEHIKRKTSQITGNTTTIKTEAGLKFNHDDVKRVLNDVQLMKGKQEAFTMKMDKMKKENEALWREVASLRQKHVKQQQIVNKLIQFMIHLVGGNRNPLSGSGLSKRKMPLMISDSSQVSAAKRPRYAKQLSIEEVTDPPIDYEYVINTPGSFEDNNTEEIPYTSGPIIHEVTDMATSSSSHPVSATQSRPIMVKNTTSSRLPTQSTADFLLPSAADLQTDLNSSLNSTDLNDLVDNIDSSILDVASPDDTSTTTAGGTGTLDVLDKNQLNQQLDTLQLEIDSLKDLMSGGEFNFDPSTILPMFNVDNTVPVSVENLLGELDTIPLQAPSQTPPPSTSSAVMGNELVQYQTPAELGIPDLSEIVANEEEENENEPIDPMSFINLLPDSNKLKEENDG